MPAAHPGKAGRSDHDRSRYQHDRLNAFGDDYGPESADDRIDSRDDGDNRYTRIHVDAKKRLQDDAARQQGEGNMNEDGRQNGYEGQPVPAGAVISPL